MHRSLFDKLAVPKLVKKISAYYGTRSLIVMFIRACYLLFFLSQINSFRVSILFS
jgi:hypothetical protein